MMMRMLEAGGIPPLTDGLRAADADNPRGYYELERVKKLPDDTSWMGEARGRAVKIISALLKYLPPGFEYRILFMNRRIDEVLASQRAMLERRGRPAEGDDERMRTLFERHLADVRARLAGRRDTCVLEVEYSATIADPSATSARVNAFLGGGLDEAAMAAAVDPALYRHR